MNIWWIAGAAIGFLYVGGYVAGIATNIVSQVGAAVQTKQAYRDRKRYAWAGYGAYDDSDYNGDLADDQDTMDTPYAYDQSVDELIT
jgi:hypothetical protein